MGLVVHPLQGAKKSIEAAMHTGNHLPCNRIQDGLEAVKTATREETNTILAKFERLKWTAKERQKSYERMAKEAMDEVGQPKRKGKQTDGAPSLSTSAVASTSRALGSSAPRTLRKPPPNHQNQGSGSSGYRAVGGDDVSDYRRDIEGDLRQLPSTSIGTSAAYDDAPPPSYYSEDRVEELYRRDLNMAIQLSQAEHGKRLSGRESEFA